MARILFVLLLFLTFSYVSEAQIYINEISATNATQTGDAPDMNFASWIELYNDGNTTMNIGGYYLSDDEQMPLKWKMPDMTIGPKAFKLFWCNGNGLSPQTNFSLDPDGEQVLLSNRAGTLVDKLSYPKQTIDISYGRASDGASLIGFMVTATPGKTNSDGIASLQLEKPTFSLEGGRYSGSQSITINHPDPKAKIYFTLDGTEPTSASSTLYAGAVSVTKTSVLKAKAFKSGMLTSKTEVATFFINEHAFTLPVISLSTNPAYLFDEAKGMYVTGNYGIASNCSEEPRNWNRDWDRHMIFEYYNKDGSKILDQNVDVRIGGACSRNNPQKSLVLKARDKFGKKTIEENFFSSKQINSFGGVILRNSGNDFYSTMFRDAFMQELAASKMDIDYLAYQPATVYINGKYWGIQNIREKVDADYIKANYGIEEDDLDLLESFGYAQAGSVDGYVQYLDSLQKIDRTSPEAYTFINRYIDVQEFINYLTAEIYSANTDWPGNNVKYWRQRSNNGKFRWILWDMDFGFGLYTNFSTATHATLPFVTEAFFDAWPNPAWSTLHLRMLLENPDFKNKFIQTLTTSLSTTFQPQRVVNLIDGFQNRIKTEMPYHTTRWGQTTEGWNFEVERLRQFAVERNAFMKNHIGSFFGLGGNVSISTTSVPLGTGNIFLNGIKTEPSESELFYYAGLNFDAKAEPVAGYKFSYWKIRKKEVSSISVIERGTTWKFHDQGYTPDNNWFSQDYLDASWQEGNAQLGYGEQDEQTMVSFGPDETNKYTTTYFRKTFSVADTSGISYLKGNCLYDDGVVIYLNGTEVFRNNLPDGTITYGTLATVGAVENTYAGFSIGKGILKPGSNVLAVEVHQLNGTTSDMSFDLDLTSFSLGSAVEYTTPTIEVSDVADSNVEIEAYFEPVVAKRGIVINEICTSNSTLADEKGEREDWIELYNAGDEPIDLAGFYVTDDLGNKKKFQIKKGNNNETIIAPGSYKILWADEDLTDGTLHVFLKLSGNGESIGLYQMEGTNLLKEDEYSFTAHVPFTTFSRIPNVTGPFVATSVATPSAENIFEVPTSVEEGEVQISLFPNPTSGSINYEGSLLIQKLVVYNTMGMIVYKGENIAPSSSIGLPDLLEGIYIFKMSFGTDSKSVKVIVK